MGSTADSPSPVERGVFDRLLGVFSDVRAGEGARAGVMLLNIFLILTCYYIIKVVREPLILTTTVPDWLGRRGITAAEVTSYSGAAQALVLMGFVPAYSWFASRVDRLRLVVGVTTFFAVNILLFGLAVQAEVRYVGVFFYIWLGLFNMSIVAQFWSYANDIYTKEAGHRLFPIIAVGMTAGAPLGSWIAARMFDAHLSMHLMLYLAAGLLLATAALYASVDRGASPHHPAAARARIGGKGGFSLVFASRYIRHIALLLVLLNFVNSMGEYLLRRLLVAHAAAAVQADPSFDRAAFMGAFAGSYMFWVSISAVALQLVATPRLVRRFGLAGVLFALPFVALGAYGFMGLGATLVIVRWAKTAENATDYSIMNTARPLLWLPTSREEKYKAKQAIDTFFVRLGDLTAAFAVFAGTTGLALGIRGFAALNVVVITAWLAVAVVLVRENHRLSAAKPGEPARA